MPVGRIGDKVGDKVGDKKMIKSQDLLYLCNESMIKSVIKLVIKLVINNVMVRQDDDGW